MNINYDFVSESRAEEECLKKIAFSLAGRLLEVTDSRFAIVYLDNDDVPVLYYSNGRLVDFFDFILSDS